MVKLSGGVMGHHHEQFSTQWVTEITTATIYFTYLRWAFHLHKLHVESSAFLTLGGWHISQPHQCACGIPAAFKAQQGGLQTLSNWGLGQKMDFPWYWTCFKCVNKSSFTGNGNPGFQAGPQRNCLCLAPYQLCLTHVGRVKLTTEQTL